MSVDFSTFRPPKTADYTHTQGLIEAFIKQRANRVEGIVYGSSVSQGKHSSFRAGFSDIDVFMCALGDGALPSFDILQKYAETLFIKHKTIRVQTHWTTKAILQSPITPGSKYLGEVLLKAPQDTPLYEILRENSIPNEYQHVDLAMMAHFLRKVMQAAINIREVRAMDHADIKEIAKLYEGYKRIFSIMTLFLRMRKGKSPFQSTKSRILSTFEKTSGITLNHDVLLAFDTDTKNPLNWSANFYRKDLDQLLEYFSSIYAEFEKVMEAILNTQVKVRKVEIRSW